MVKPRDTNPGRGANRSCKSLTRDLSARERIAFRPYAGGHVFYLLTGSRAGLAANVRRFYEAMSRWAGCVPSCPNLEGGDRGQTCRPQGPGRKRRVRKCLR